MIECPSRFEIVQWQVQEFDKRKQQQIGLHLKHCKRCAQVVAELAEDQAYCQSRRAVNLVQIRDQIERDLEPARHGFVFRLPLFVPVVGAAAAVLLAVFGYMIFEQANVATDDPTGVAQVRFKGAVALAAVAARGPHSFELEPKSELRGGDKIQFSVTVSKPGYLAIYHADANGEVTPAVPSDSHGKPWAAPAPGRHQLSATYTISSGQGTETFWVVFARDSFDVGPVGQRLAAALAQTAAEQSDRIELAPFVLDRLSILRING